jgi:dTDP-4-amino-4,6-dideoxygalactose transaminase
MKRGIEDLAVLGGAPAFEEPLHVGYPNVGSRAALSERLEEILDRNWLTNDGPVVTEFEERLRAELGVENVVATCNGTSALELLLDAHKLRGEVILPSLTFVASAHAVRSRGLTPVFADVDPETCTLDPVAVKALISPDTAAILGVHLWGRLADVDGLAEVAERHGVLLLFDAAQAFGCARSGSSAGAFGAGAAFSFHATKVLNSFEGGAIATDDSALAERLRLRRSFGFSDIDQVESWGTNAKMAEIAGAMGITSLESLPQFIARNRSNYESYRSELEGIPGFRLLPYPEGEPSNFHYVVGFVDEPLAGLGRDPLVETLRAENILARRYFHPGCHRMQPYAAEASGMKSNLPMTEKLLAKVVCLPTGMAVDSTDISKICDVVRCALAQGEELGTRIAERASGDG